MAVRIWLHRTAPRDVPAPWALELAERCRRYHILPGAGGAYDQDEDLMAAIEQAIGISELFDIDGRKLLTADEKLKELHAQMTAEAAALAELVNQREHDDAQSGIKPPSES